MNKMESNNNGQEWTIEISRENDAIKLELVNINENRISKSIKNSDFIIENVHDIGRSLEYEYNKKYNVILEPYNISRIIGLVNDLIIAKANK
tara:strand:+ start:8895 stop:9170 length:276 start_codon:yes stop_codon:yes gene_type:complete